MGGSIMVSRGEQAAASAVGRATATRRTVQWLGLIAATAGVEHGIGEVAQGWQRPPGLVFLSWAETGAFRLLGGEPAMSLIPDFVLSGLATVAVAIVLGVWCATQVHRRSAGLVIIAMSLVLLLVGGGFGPPLIGVVTGALATRIRAVPRRWAGPRWIASILAWRWTMAAAVAGFLTLVPGLVVLEPVLPTSGSSIVGAVTLFAFVATAAAMATARAHDRSQAHPA